jgi:hypothetical protein
MKKLLIVSIVFPTSPSESGITSIATEIESFENELAMKTALELSRDPEILIGTLSRGKSEEQLKACENDFNNFRLIIPTCESIKANFLPLEKCGGICETCLIHWLLEKDYEVMYSVQELIAAGKRDLLLISCPN